MHKDLRKIVKALEAQGFTVDVTAKQHVMVSRGDGSSRRSPERRATGGRSATAWPR
jgi:hypothetical protein